eukprot:TRINITY_DN4027_c0_g1_i1.p1 TRINITY_DN4027_c0_g1~~TRINITY_DN4027_c0_g1_i1.p1  ORF type:complete len:897 (-),score=169.55 TRINITY_DN4027_c0_g1_i1:12-2702(-)
MEGDGKEKPVNGDEATNGAEELSDSDKAEAFMLRELALKLWLEETLCVENLVEEADPTGTTLAAHYLNDLLENGVLLCRLMLTLKEKSIPKVHQGKDEHGFGRGKNIAFFLQACEEHGVPSASLFRTGDLFLTIPGAPPKGSRVGSEFTGPGQFYRVIDCLEHLAGLADTEWGFYFKLKSPAEVKRRMDEGEYNSPSPNAMFIDAAARHRADAIVRKWGRAMALKNAASAENLVKAIVVKKRGETKSTVPLRPSAPSSPSGSAVLAKSATVPTVAGSAPPVKPKKPEFMRAVSATISLPTDEPVIRGFTRFQALWRGYVARNDYKRRTRNIAYRENVAQEIYKTEKDFIESLRILFSVYLDPIQARMEDSMWKGGSKREDEVELKAFKGLYNDLKVILAYNTKLLTDMKPIVENWNPNSKIARIFLDLSAFLKVYTQYVKGYEASRMEFTNAKRANPTFKRFLLEAEENNKEKLNGHDIGAFLIRPVQRIPRYLLLLKDLTKHTEKDHADYATLHQAWEAIEKVAVYIEEKAEEADNFHMVSSIQARFSNRAENLVSVGRKYVRQGELEASVPKKGKKRIERLFILFSDALVEAKKNRSDSKMGSILGRKRSQTMGVASMSKDLTFKRIYNLKQLKAKDDEDRTSYGIVLTNTALGECVLRLYAPSKLVKFEWLNDFNAIRSKLEQDRRQRDIAIRNSTSSVKLTRAISQQAISPGVDPSSDSSGGFDGSGDNLLAKDPRKRTATVSTSSPASANNAQLEKSQSCRNLMSVPEEEASSPPPVDPVADAALQQINTSKKDRQKSGGNFMGRLQSKSRANSFDPRSQTLRTDKEKEKEKRRSERHHTTSGVVSHRRRDSNSHVSAAIAGAGASCEALTTSSGEVPTTNAKKDKRNKPE